MADVPPPRSRQLTGKRALPLVVTLGFVTIAIGLGADLLEHTVLAAAHPHASDGVVAGFSTGEHLAHLLVLIGMVAVLVGVIVDGTRTAGRFARPERSARDALR